VPAVPDNVPAEVAESAAQSTPPHFTTRKQRLLSQVHALSQQGRSYSAIARKVGLHRITVKRWLAQEPPAATATLAMPADSAHLIPPPAPWSDWDQVSQVREALQEHRFLLLRRPENLDIEQQQQVAALLASPVGTRLQVARSFLEDWYRLWKDEGGARPALADAQARYETWRTNPTYGAVSQLRRVQQQMTSPKFEHLSQFLRGLGWEATNNGAERAGRAFRHRQAPHFNLRNKDYIADAITVSACVRKTTTLQAPSRPFHTCQRGRQRRPIVSTERQLPVGITGDGPAPVHARSP
jgi:transposase